VRACRREAESICVDGVSGYGGMYAFLEFGWPWTVGRDGESEEEEEEEEERPVLCKIRCSFWRVQVWDGWGKKEEAKTEDRLTASGFVC
jgi:hypothetical protein